MSSKVYNLEILELSKNYGKWYFYIFNSDSFDKICMFAKLGFSNKLYLKGNINLVIFR